MAIDIQKYQKLAYQKQEEHNVLLESIANADASVINQYANDLHEETFKRIDCLDCANCCKGLGPRIEQEDIAKISDFLNISASAFVGEYLEMDEDGDFIFKAKPCPFLQENNLCRIYEARPLACKEYPHTDNNSFHNNLEIAKKNISICPAVYEIVEAFKKIDY